MFDGNVYLVTRSKKTVHAGIKMNGYMVSVCNLRWDYRDTVVEGKAAEVTCKRCKKIIERADESGHVILNLKK